MKTFTDNTGRVWTLAVNVAAIKRVRALCGVDLTAIVELDKNNNPDTKLLEQLSSDPVLLVDVLYAICKAECDQKGVTDEDFGMAMAGDAIEHATTALLDEIIDFFPAPKRNAFQKILSATRRFEEIARKRLDAIMADGEFEKKHGLRTGTVNRLIWEAAGICGINPDPFTLRELLIMADGRGKMEWAQTSNLMAMIVNVMRDPKKSKAVSASEFNPYTNKKHAGKAPLSILRDIWCKKQKGEKV